MDPAGSLLAAFIRTLAVAEGNRSEAAAYNMGQPTAHRTEIAWMLKTAQTAVTSADFVNATLTNDLGRIGPGQARALGPREAHAAAADHAHRVAAPCRAHRRG